MAVRVSGADGYLMRRAGFGEPMIYLVMLSTEKCAYDPYNWGRTRTMQIAHQWIEKNWDEAVSGQVVDVQAIIGETTEPKKSDRLAETYLV